MSNYRIGEFEYQQIALAMALMGTVMPPYREYARNSYREALREGDSYLEQLRKLGEATVDTQEPAVDVKAQVISDLRQAMVSLQNAYNRAVKAQPICGDVAVFVKIQGMSKELNGVMIDVNKLRGL